MVTAAQGRRVNTKEARQEIASGFQTFRGMSYVLSGIACPTPEFPNQSSAHIARGYARNGGINISKNSKYRKNFLFWQLKILEGSSFVTKLLCYFVFVFICGGSPEYKKYFRDTCMEKKGGKHFSKKVPG
jgi:hypothetical protein